VAVVGDLFGVSGRKLLFLHRQLEPKYGGTGIVYGLCPTMPMQLVYAGGRHDDGLEYPRKKGEAARLKG
jgi:hypothetical protein